MFKAIYSFFAALGILGIISYFVLLIAGIVGYVMNLYKLVMMIIEPGVEFTVLLVGRAVGVFFGPLGAILGYF